MEDIMNWVQTDVGMGVTAAVVIFLITLFLAARRNIGMATTIVLLFVALAVGYVLANRTTLSETKQTTTTSRSKKEPQPIAVIVENAAAFEQIEQAPEHAITDDG